MPCKVRGFSVYRRFVSLYVISAKIPYNTRLCPRNVSTGTAFRLSLHILAYSLPRGLVKPCPVGLLTPVPCSRGIHGGAVVYAVVNVHAAPLDLRGVLQRLAPLASLGTRPQAPKAALWTMLEYLPSAGALPGYTLRLCALRLSVSLGVPIW